MPDPPKHLVLNVSAMPVLCLTTDDHDQAVRAAQQWAESIQGSRFAVYQLVQVEGERE